MSARSMLVKSLPCLACQMQKVPKQCGVTEEHHLNLGGWAGQKRRGDDYSIPLGKYHHRGVPPDGISTKLARAYFGPSLALHSRAFRTRYGTDRELLALTNAQLERQCPQIA